MMLAAYSLGVDSCWIHRAREMFETEEGKALKAKWGLGDNYIGVGNCILGYRDCEYPAPKPRKEGRIIHV
jgi:nitroreductase